MRNVFTQLTQLIESASGNIFWKNCQHEYLGCNNNLLVLPTLVTIKTNNDLIGKTIHQLLPSELAEPIFKTDEYVIKNNIETTTEEIGINNNGTENYYLSKKMPLYDPNGSVVGLIGISFDITQYKNLTEQLMLIKNLNKQISQDIKEIADAKKFTTVSELAKDNSIQRFYLAGQPNEIYLTKREAECILQLAKGNSAKQTGRLLNLSPRTVESYIAKIKKKLACHTVAELISKLIPFLKELT